MAAARPRSRILPWKFAHRCRRESIFMNRSRAVNLRRSDRPSYASHSQVAYRRLLCVPALADPEHEQHDDFMEWDISFDPKKFDARQATRAMKKGVPDWRE